MLNLIHFFFFICMKPFKLISGYLSRGVLTSFPFPTYILILSIFYTHLSVVQRFSCWEVCVPSRSPAVGSLEPVRSCFGFFPLRGHELSFHISYHSFTITLVPVSSSYFDLAVSMCEVFCVGNTSCIGFFSLSLYFDAN